MTLIFSSIILVTAFFVSGTQLVLAATDITDLFSTIIYTTGGQGFHRQLMMHLPLIGDTTEEKGSSATTELIVTFQLRLRNTFFIDVAEAENLWDAKILESKSDNNFDLAAQIPSAASRGGKGFVKAVRLHHPIQTLHPYDIEAPTVKTPYLYNDANVTFVFTIDLSIIMRKTSSGVGALLAILSIPIHERYEDVATDPAQTHVERCVPAEDIKIRVAGEGAKRFAYCEDLPIHFSQTEDTTNIVSTVGFGGTTALSAASNNGEKLLSAEHFCVRVPVGYIGDLPAYYWSTMACMVVGAVAVWAGLTFV